MTASSANAINALNSYYLRSYPEEALQSAADVSRRDQVELMTGQPVSVAINIWQHLPLDMAADVLTELPENIAVQCLLRGDSVHAARVLKRLPNEKYRFYYDQLDSAKQKELEELVQYPDDSAGTLMNVHFLQLYEHLSVQDVLQRIRKFKPKFTRHLFVVADDGILKGRIELQELALADHDTRLSVIIKPVVTAVVATATKEEVVDQFERYHVTDLPVVDVNGRLIGVILHNTLLDESLKETGSDLLTMVGVSKEERGLSKVNFVVKKRLPWLFINLLTAFLAASVVGIFESTIAKFTALAVLLPVVAGQSGNTGAQALAVTMRSYALREIGISHWWRVMRKEMGAGLINGVVIALVTAIGVMVWSQSYGLALVIGVSMIISMVLAGVSGVIVPLILIRMGQDPASSSSIILTTVTDIVGFFSFLGIATLLSTLL